MEILSLSLYTHNLENQYQFFLHTLGLPTSKTADSVSIKIGYTELIFKESEQPYKYHYCFLIPSNTLIAAKDWFAERLDLVAIEDDRYIAKFQSWNAESFYFWDGAGNLAECIVRHDLANFSNQQFDEGSLLNVNEIGLCVADEVASLAEFLSQQVGTSLYRGDLERFGVHGDEHGLFLLINNQLKSSWYPTSLVTQSSPFEITIKHLGITHSLAFDGKQLFVVE